jgi:hypothetical protein
MKRIAELRRVEPVIDEKLVVLPNEIECPRCQDVMVLYSGFDFLYYSCDECGFVLSHLKK